MNRLMEIGSKRIEIEHVEIHPIATFQSRFAKKVREGGKDNKWDVIYASQCVYSTQETIVLDLEGFVGEVEAELKGKENEDCFFVVDGYHGFGAIPTSLSTFTNTFYVAGMLKHVGSGANCAFLVVPKVQAEKVRRREERFARRSPLLTPRSLRFLSQLKPVFTGWIADPSVLSPESKGIKLGSEVREGTKWVRRKERSGEALRILHLLGSSLTPLSLCNRRSGTFRGTASWGAPPPSCRASSSLWRS